MAVLSLFLLVCYGYDSESVVIVFIVIGGGVLVLYIIMMLVMGIPVCTAKYIT